MKIVVNKHEELKRDYKAGDVISLGNPYSEKHYLLFNGKECGLVGAINLITNKLEYYYSDSNGFNFLVRNILEEHDWDEWTWIKSEDVTMTLNCKNGAIEQQNNSGSF